MAHQQFTSMPSCVRRARICLKERRTPGEPETFPAKLAHIAALKVKKKHPPLQEGQDSLDHTPALRLVGVLLWVSLRTRPDVSWAVARTTRLAVPHVLQPRPQQPTSTATRSTVTGRPCGNMQGPSTRPSASSLGKISFQHKNKIELDDVQPAIVAFVSQSGWIQASSLTAQYAEETPQHHSSLV